MKTTFGTHDQTSYILNRQRRQHRGKRLDKEFDQLNSQDDIKQMKMTHLYSSIDHKRVTTCPPTLFYC